MIQFFSNRKRGFTLIELLVVIAIIGILSTIVLVSMGSARAKARDAKRQSDIRQIATAMELFYTDNNNAYSTTTIDVNGRVSTLTLTPYLATIPSDPGGGSSADCNDSVGGYHAVANGAGSQYCIFACMESGGGYFVATAKGVKSVTASSTSLDGCEAL